MSGNPVEQKYKFTPLQAEQFITKYSDTRSRKKKELQKFILAHSDVSSAYKTCELFIEKVAQSKEIRDGDAPAWSHPLYFPFLEAMIVSYARPFTENRSVGVLSKKWSQFDNLELKEIHNLMLKSRHELVAHSDRGVKKTRIIPANAKGIWNRPGKIVLGPGFAVRGYGISLPQVLVFYQLAGFQGQRLWDEAERLLAELYSGMELPLKPFDLRIDEGL